MFSSILNQDLLKKIVSLGFAGYRSKGVGCVILKEPATLTYTEVPEELLSYMPYRRDDRDFPFEAAAMMKNYDPLKEVVLVVIDRTAKTLVLKLTAQQAGVGPMGREDEISKD